MNKILKTEETNSLSIERQMLQTFVPVNALTEDHLKTLMRDHSVEMVCAGQSIFCEGDYDGRHVYLLSGQITFTGSKDNQFLDADDDQCRFPLENHQPRRVTATAVTDCSVIAFDSSMLDGMLAWDQAAKYIMLDIAAQRDLDEDAEWMMTLLKSNLFYKVPPMNIRQILNRFSAVCVSANDMVIRQGEIGDCCYFIKEGKAGVYRAGSDQGRSQLLAELDVGLCFGEDALLRETVRNATVKMHSNGVLMVLEKQDFFLLLKQPLVDSIHFVDAKLTALEGSRWLDVRTQDEFDAGHCLGAVNMPLDILKLKARMLDEKIHYITYCDTGRRSEAAAYLMSEDGFNVSALAGGTISCSSSDEQYFLAESTMD